MTMTLVQTVTVGAGGAASIEFTGIPQTGTDLVVVVSARASNAVTEWPLTIKFNSISTGYSSRFLEGSGTAASSNNGSTTAGSCGYHPAANVTTSTFGSSTIYIPNYTSSIAKSYSADTVLENNTTATRSTILAGAWSGTAAITSISIFGGSTMVQYSTASLYTITKGSGGATVS